ncbi:hypothetical protein SHKM778_32440 [Streptomyces sp. KM77-8]|uniref:Uncharacterized protein n=1 Tax=Streptomyces haneummycinicus TaxID=3074435 RepID=A0AAT9HHF7_9ACTN
MDAQLRGARGMQRDPVPDERKQRVTVRRAVTAEQVDVHGGVEQGGMQPEAGSLLPAPGSRDTSAKTSSPLRQAAFSPRNAGP